VKSSGCESCKGARYIGAILAAAIGGGGKYIMGQCFVGNSSLHKADLLHNSN